MFIYLENGDSVKMTLEGYEIFDADGNSVTRNIKESSASSMDSELGEYRHYMLKEIYEQPVSVQNTLTGRVEKANMRDCIVGDQEKLKAVFEKVREVQIQSGETADTLAALENVKQNGCLATLSICNVPESSLTRESDFALMTVAGPEIGVASTKAFTTQLVALQLLTIALMQRDPENDELAKEMIGNLPLLWRVRLS